MANSIMIQGTMSGAGKSLLCTALCRIFNEDGYRVAPFKAQNMALNSYITEEGAEIGRAQAVQAFAARVSPSALMNPVLLKPTGDTGSQLIVNGIARDTMSAKDYYKYKKALIPEVRQAFENLSAENDIIVIEGAGSPAEINLRQDDFVNMGMAEIADCRVLLCGDIDRGGVFAQLYGTKALLTKDEQERIGGFIINKFRGDLEILEPGIKELEQLCGKPVLGTVPYVKVDIEEEDSLTTKLSYNSAATDAIIDIAVVRFPRISNFTDFQALDLETDVNVRYVSRPAELDTADVIILPGTKNTIQDFKWLYESGLAERIQRCHKKGKIIFGICGGFQMLGQEIVDECGAENQNIQKVTGLSFLEMNTFFETKKQQQMVKKKISAVDGIWEKMAGVSVKGYEVHAGRSEGADADRYGGFTAQGSVVGTYIHGIFDSTEFRNAFIETAAQLKGVTRGAVRRISYEAYRDEQIDILASAVRKSLDMDKIYELVFAGGCKKTEDSLGETIEYIKPADIEKRSMELIESELGGRKYAFTEDELSVVKRVIHTSADFEYADNLVFGEQSVPRIRAVLENGCTIITDTRMAYSGINKRRLAKLGVRADCFIDDEQVAQEAAARGITRSAAAVEKAVALSEDIIYVVGNAPTALIRLYELIAEGRAANIKAIIGVPVGFVNVVPSKELILSLKLPYIVAKGRKGGSNVAASIVNALVYGI